MSVRTRKLSPTWFVCTIVRVTNAVTFVQTSLRMSQTTAGNLLSPQSSSNSGKGVNDDSENDFAVGTLDSDQVGRLSF